MIKNIKELSDLIKIDNYTDTEKIVFDVLKIIQKQTDLVLTEKNIVIKNNILKVKTNSNNRFIIFLNLNNINVKIKELNYKDKNFILEL